MGQRTKGGKHTFMIIEAMILLHYHLNFHLNFDLNFIVVKIDGRSVSKHFIVLSFIILFCRGFLVNCCFASFLKVDSPFVCLLFIASQQLEAATKDPKGGRGGDLAGDLHCKWIGASQVGDARSKCRHR